MPFARAVPVKDRFSRIFNQQPYDCYPDTPGIWPLVPDKWTTEPTAEIEFLARFGRPLYAHLPSGPIQQLTISRRFWSMIEATDDHALGARLAFRLACSKLACQSQMSSALSPMAELAAIDVLEKGG